jgi:hypothetical protein
VATLAKVNGPHPGQAPGHAFISYVRQDAARVDRLQAILQAAGITVWRDTADLWPGADWKVEIRNAIRTGSLAFIACFSENSERREKSFQYEELILAAEEMRLRRPGVTWLIPIRFADCEMPIIDLGTGRTLDSLQRVDLFGDSWERGAARLVATVLKILGTPYPRMLGGPAIGELPNSTQFPESLRTAEKDPVFKSAFQHPRMRGDNSIADLRTWLVCSALAANAVVMAFLAFHDWPKRCVQNHGPSCSYQLSPHRYIAYVVMAVGLAVFFITIIESLISSSNSIASQQALDLALNRRSLKVLRRIRAIISIIAIPLVFSGLFHYENLHPPWSAALASLGGLALIAIATEVVRCGDNALVAGALLLFAGTLLPVQISSGPPKLGVSTLSGVLAAGSAIAIAVGWYYYLKPTFLLLFTTPTLPIIVPRLYSTNEIIGPYVIVVAVASILLALSVGANRNTWDSVGPEAIRLNLL